MRNMNEHALTCKGYWDLITNVVVDCNCYMQNRKEKEKERVVQLEDTIEKETAKLADGIGIGLKNMGFSKLQLTDVKDNRFENALSAIAYLQLRVKQLELTMQQLETFFNKIRSAVNDT